MLSWIINMGAEEGLFTTPELLMRLQPATQTAHRVGFGGFCGMQASYRAELIGL